MTEKLTVGELIDQAKNCVRDKSIGIEVFDVLRDLHLLLTDNGGNITFYKSGDSKKFSISLGYSDYGKTCHLQRWFDNTDFDSFAKSLKSAFNWAKFCIENQ